DIPEYAEFSRKIRDSSERNNHAQQGDPAKLGSVIEQLALDPQAPTHFVVGSDAVQIASGRLNSRKLELEAWRELATSTDTPNQGEPLLFPNQLQKLLACITGLTEYTKHNRGINT